jgi:hypothetical protein
MRNFSWKYFTLTGDVESFMLYREVDQFAASEGSSALGADDFNQGLEPDDAAGSQLQ